MVERIGKLEAVDKFKVNPIVFLIILLILLVTTGSVRRAKRVMELINREFIEDTASSPKERMENFKMLSKSLNDTLSSGEIRPLSHIAKHTKTVKVEDEVAGGPLLNGHTDLKTETLKPPSEARDLDDTLISYIKIKKSRISISECSRDIGVPPSEVKKALVRLHETGRIKLQWGIEHDVGSVQSRHSKTYSNSF